MKNIKERLTLISPIPTPIQRKGVKGMMSTPLFTDLNLFTIRKKTILPVPPARNWITAANMILMVFCIIHMEIAKTVKAADILENAPSIRKDGTYQYQSISPLLTRCAGSSAQKKEKIYTDCVK